MLFNVAPEMREDVRSSQVVDFKSDTTGCVDKAPVGLYYDADGNILGKKIALDSNSKMGQYGIVTGGNVAANGAGKAIVKGKATLVTNSVAGNPVTAISNAGVATDSVEYGVTNVDTALAVSTDTSGGIILL